MSYYVKSIMMPTPLTANDVLLSDQIAQARFELSINVRKITRERFMKLSHWLDELEYKAWTENGNSKLPKSRKSQAN